MLDRSREHFQHVNVNRMKSLRPVGVDSRQATGDVVKRRGRIRGGDGPFAGPHEVQRPHDRVAVTGSKTRIVRRIENLGDVDVLIGSLAVTRLGRGVQDEDLAVQNS